MLLCITFKQRVPASQKTHRIYSSRKENKTRHLKETHFENDT